MDMNDLDDEDKIREYEKVKWEKINQNLAKLNAYLSNTNMKN